MTPKTMLFYNGPYKDLDLWKPVHVALNKIRFHVSDFINFDHFDQFTKLNN